MRKYCYSKKKVLNYIIPMTNKEKQRKQHRVSKRGLTTAPTKRGILDMSSMIMNMNGWSALNVKGGGCWNWAQPVTQLKVTAAASVPISLTSIYALCSIAVAGPSLTTSLPSGEWSTMEGCVNPNDLITFETSKSYGNLNFEFWDC